MKTILIIFAITFVVVTAFDEDLVKEKKCSEINSAPDFNWMGSIDKWYIPLWSKFYKYRTAQDLFEREGSTILKSEVEAACFTYLKDGWLSGFNQKRKWNVTSDGKSFEFKGLWKGAKSAKFSFDMTDNKNFLFGTTCWEDGETGWAVMTTKTTIEPCDKEKIFARVKSLGFNEKFIVEESYDNCDDEDESK